MSDARKKFMMRAIALSSKAVRTNQGGPFGAVVVRKGKIVGEGWIMYHEFWFVLLYWGFIGFLIGLIFDLRSRPSPYLPAQRPPL